MDMIPKHTFAYYKTFRPLLSGLAMAMKITSMQGSEVFYIFTLDHPDPFFSHWTYQ